MRKPLAALNARKRHPFVLILLSALLMLAIALICLPQRPHRQPRAQHPASHLAPEVQQLLTNDTLVSQICASKNFVYFPNADLLLASTSKGGSTSVFQWLYEGITGEQYSGRKCHTNAPNIGSDCWNTRAIYMKHFSTRQQRRILTSPSTMRLAVQRDAFDRLISAFNDKFACITKQFNVGLIHSAIVPYTRKLARLPSSPRLCMNISEFALALDRIRNDSSIDLQKIDVHIRPQQLYFDYVPYDLVMDVSDMANRSLLLPVIERLPFGERLRHGMRRHNSVRKRRRPLLIPEKAARQLHHFALETHMGERRHLSPS